MDTGNYLNHEASYNNRLQPNGTDVFIEGENDNLMRLTYNFVDSNGHNNGNVISISNYYDATRSQQFTYDQVNRIVTAESTSTYASSPAHCWGEAYVYDNATTTSGEFGNLTNINVASTAYNGCTQESLSVVASTTNQITTFSYDGVGNVLNDTLNAYAWNAESEIKTAAGVNYTYDGDGNRLQKSSGKIYWYGAGSEVLDESDSSGNFTDEYVYFGGKRVSHRVVSTNALYFYGEDMLGTSRTVFTSAGVLCYDADFYPFGGERAYTDTCAQHYKFEGKERDSETNNDDFGARYYSPSFGRWTSPDWSAIPAPVPYANLTNPQTLNLYSMVSDNPETFADLDGHDPGDNPGNRGGTGPPSPSTTDTEAEDATNQQAKATQVQVQASVIDQGKVVQGEKQQDGTSVTGVRGIIQDTITVNGKPLSGVKVDETNVSTTTVNGNPMSRRERPGSATTNNAGQISDTVGLLAPARAAAQDKGLIQGLKTQAVTVTNTNAITFTVPGGGKYSATATRTLTNVGANGKVNSSYKLNTSQPVVSAVP